VRGEAFALYASPLDKDPLQVRSEVRVIRDAFQESGSGVRLSVGTATIESLMSLLTLSRTRRGLVLHLSAHAVKCEQTGRLGLVLEDARGVSHVLWRQNLEELLGIRDQGLRNVSLLFLSTCWSEELAQVFVECGCKHVISLHTKVTDPAARRFAQSLYFSLGCGEPLLAAWDGARRALRNHPEESFQKQAEHFVLYGQRGAESSTLRSLCGVEENISSGPALRGANLEDSSVYMEHKLPPSAEHFTGRSQEMHMLLQRFDGPYGSRACVVHGPEGIGKSALSLELAGFASAPGRFFSCAARMVRIEEDSLSSILEAIEEEVEGLAGTLRVPLRPAASPGASSSRSSAVSTPSCAMGASDGAGFHQTGSSLGIYPELMDTLDQLLMIRQRIRRGIHQIERARLGRPILLAIDDKVGAVAGNTEVQRMLGELLDNTHELRLLICSQEPIYGSLGATKVTNCSLPGLQKREAARLFLQRVHRPLSDEDFPPELVASTRQGSCTPSSLKDLHTLWLLRSPVLDGLKGNPARIRALADRVVPGSPSLPELSQMLELGATAHGAPTPRTALSKPPSFELAAARSSGLTPELMAD
jgi:hypothetical protein